MQLYLANNGEVPAVVEHPPEGGQLCVGDGVVAAELLPQPHCNRQAQNVGALRTLDVEVQSSALSNSLSYSLNIPPLSRLACKQTMHPQKRENLFWLIRECQP